MKMTIRRKITLAAVILGCVTVINGYITFQYTQKVNSKILQVLNIEEPLEDALQEMEISTGRSAESILNYIQNYENRINEREQAQISKRDFEKEMVSFLSMAERTQEQQLGQLANITYSRFFSIGEEIMKLKDEQNELLQPLRFRVSEISDTFEELAQIQLLFPNHPDAPLHLKALFEMLDIVAELQIKTEGLLTTQNKTVVQHLQQDIPQYTLEFNNAYRSYRGTTFSIEEADLVEKTRDDFVIINEITWDLLSKTEELIVFINDFTWYLDKIDGIIDDINPLVSNATTNVTQEALRSSQLALRTTWIYSIFGLASVGTLLIGANRWVIKPIQILIKGIENFATGSLTKKIDIKSDDEIGQLASAFNEMTVQIDDKIATIIKNEMELEQLNVNLEAEMKKRMEYEQEMLKIARENEVDRVRSRFLSTITHELRTPLTSIKGYIDIIRSGFVGEVPEEIDELLEVVTRNTDRLSTLTNDLLDIQRIETGRLDVELSPIDLREVLASCVEEIKPFLDEKNQQLHTETPDDPIIIQGDQVRLSQVVMNLLNNASKFSPEEKMISLEAVLAGEEVKVSISDNGIGIKKKDLERVFEPLAMIEKPIYVKGTGLGLSVSKGIIDLHEGRIWAESEGEWKGATFIITLPLWRE
jgi:signal transduction histidine kinase